MESGGVIPMLTESDRKSLCALRYRHWAQYRRDELERRGRFDFEDRLADWEQSFVQTEAETFGQFDNLFLAQQTHDISQAIVHSPAVITTPEVLLDTESYLRRKITLQIIGQLPSDLIAIDFYDTRFA
jgi:hypothetical protein